jgi:hypothetical protein
MRNTLLEGNPAVVVEVIPHRPGERPAEVLEFMGSVGYRGDAAAGDVLFAKEMGVGPLSRRRAQPRGGRLPA